MRWVDLTGAPGSGKSTLVDGLWPPRCVEYDGKGHPSEWKPFLACVNRLLSEIKDHPSYRRCVSMINRSFNKMATVSRMKDDRIYIQTGLAQRGLGIGWRLKDQERIAEYYEQMPVSLGVVLLYADVKTIQRRNVERGKDRSHMVPFMERPREIAAEVLKARGVPILEIDTVEPVDDNIERILGFAGATAGADRSAAA